MRHFSGVVVLLGCWLSAASAAEPPKPMVTGLKNPQSVAVGTDGRIYIGQEGDKNKEGDAGILVVEDGKAAPFATGLISPRGMVAFQQWLFVVENDHVLRIDKKGKVQEFAGPKAFPVKAHSLQAVTVDELGTLYVLDAKTNEGNDPTIFRIDAKGKVSVVVDGKKNRALNDPGCIAMDGMSYVLVTDATGEVNRFKIADGTSTKVIEGMGMLCGIAWDHFGKLYVSTYHTGDKVYVIPRPGEKPVLLASGFKCPAFLCLDPTGKFLLVLDTHMGTLTALPTQVPGQEIDESPLPVDHALAFPDLKWKGWTPDIKGRPNPLRPIVLTHAGDGSNRVFVATEHGVIHVFPNDQKATDTQVFLDIQDRVVYNNSQNEEGFLGLAFHPNYKKNGEFFVFYTTKTAKLTNVISRFHVSKDDPNKADPDSEEILLKIEKPYWNHDGGTLCFGPDGYLYFTHGDGGLANDPQKNGQKLSTLLGKVLRIDVDHKDAGKNYAIPKDNPFVSQKDAAPEVWAYGLRNIWRMSFDRKTGVLWAGDVGQNLYEEIDLIVKGGNYGWSVREGLHPFSDNGVDVNKDIVEPIWEYHHDLGKCIIGGHVYRGAGVPVLEGMYIYCDYVTGQIWALRYDEAKKRVVANRTIRQKGTPILSFGEDEKGEVYSLEETATGKGIRMFAQPKGGK
jgi:glucose/arabinose dehydrogenase